MMIGIIRWESPYGSKPDFAMTLQDNPGRWAVIYEGESAGWVSSSERSWFEAPEAACYELKWIPIDKNKVRIRGILYVRYVGSREGAE